MKILLAVDDTHFAQQAAESLARQFHPNETEIRVIHALQPIAVSSPPQMAAGYFPELNGEIGTARHVAEEAAGDLEKLGFAASYTVMEGIAEDVILEEANAWKPDLIVVGSHRKKGLDRLLLGSVSEAVARKAHCSVEILRTAA